VLVRELILPSSYVACGNTVDLVKPAAAAIGEAPDAADMASTSLPVIHEADEHGQLIDSLYSTVVNVDSSH